MTTGHENRDVKTPHGSAHPVPLRALAISLGAMAIPVLGTFLLPGWVEEDQGVLIWLTSLVPAFLLAYYRGLKGVALALAGGMAVLSLTQVAVLVLGVASPNWVLLLSVVALYLGISVGIALFAEVLHRERRTAEQQALVDHLTGLPNRRHAELTLDFAFAAARRGRALVVVMFDLDHFKRVNDRNGHDAGDEVLRVFAQILKANTRRMDLSARFGGEEFLSILPDSDTQAVTEFVGRVREEIRTAKFPWGRVTVSCGAAAYSQGMGSCELLIAAADRALYAAKDAGRDRIEMALDATPRTRTPPPPPPPPLGESTPTKTPERTPQTVLVVDDDDDPRRFIVRVLAKAGYHTEDTNDPHQVIRRYEDGKHDIDLLITDVMMPKMNGLTLVDRVSGIVPNPRVVYMSGYVQGQTSWAGLPGQVCGFLEKPIDLAKLRETVRDALDRDPSTQVEGSADSAERAVE